MDVYQKHVLSCLLLDKDGDTPCIDIIPIVREHQLFGGKKISSLDSVVKTIHGHLCSSKTRKNGLGLLQVLVEQCSTDVFLAHVNTWITLLTQILESHDSKICHQAACNILSEILETTSCFPELSREIANSTVPRVFPLLMEASLNWRDPALACIGVCIKKFPGPCGLFKNKLESMIWQELSANTMNQNVIACFALLPRCGGAGNHGMKFTENWTEQCGRLLDGLNQTLDYLYDGLETGSAYHKVEKRSELSFPDSEPARGKYLTGHFQTLALCLETLLHEPFPAVVQIPVENILQTVSRCLAINKNILLSRPTTSKVWLLTRLPFLQTSALAVLSRLIHSVAHGLLTHSDVINKIYLESLFSTHWESVTSGQECPLRFLRQSVYSGLLLWLQVAGYGTSLITEEKDLVKEILHDIIPVTDTVKLDVNKQRVSDGPPVKKKQKGGGYQELGQGIGSQRKLNHSANVELTVAALSVLTALIDTFGSSWKAKTHKEILESVISTTMSIQQNCQTPVPYKTSSCRLALYQTLLACTTAVHPDVPSPLQTSLGLFRRSLQDHCLEVRVFGSKALSQCESLIHPRAPCIHGPCLSQCMLFILTHGRLENNNSIHDQHSEKLDTHTSLDPITRETTDIVERINDTHRTKDLLSAGNNKDSSQLAIEIEDSSDGDIEETVTDAGTERRGDVVVSSDDDQVMVVEDQQTNDRYQNESMFSEARDQEFVRDEETQKTVHVISVASFDQESVIVSGGKFDRTQSPLTHGLDSLPEQPSQSERDSHDNSPKSVQSGSEDQSLASSSTKKIDQPTAEVEAMMQSFVNADPDSE